MRDDTTTMNLRYDFTADEIRDRGKELAALVRDLCQLEDNRRQSMAAFKEQHELLQTKLKAFSRQVDSGYEMRDVECAVWWNSPEPCKKTIVRLDSGEQVAIMPMSQEELQEEFNFIVRGVDAKQKAAGESQAEPNTSAEAEEGEAE